MKEKKKKTDTYLLRDAMSINIMKYEFANQNGQEIASMVVHNHIEICLGIRLANLS